MVCANLIGSLQFPLALKGMQTLRGYQPSVPIKTEHNLYHKCRTGAAVCRHSLTAMGKVSVWTTAHAVVWYWWNVEESLWVYVGLGIICVA